MASEGTDELDGIWDLEEDFKDGHKPEQRGIELKLFSQSSLHLSIHLHHVTY